MTGHPSAEVMRTPATDSEAIAAGVLHSAAALHHLQHLAAADARLNSVDALGLDRLRDELAAMAQAWQHLAEGERRRDLLARLGLDEGD